MNEYEGLNLPQLLDLMHGLVEPEPVSLAPRTAGWWVIGLWLAVVTLLIAWHVWSLWRRNRYRRAALARLDALAGEVRAGTAGAAPIAVLLKRTALAAYPRQRVAALYGAEWARFLCQSSRHDRVVEEAADRLATAAYRRDADAASLIAPARRWIEVHRPEEERRV